MGSTGNYKNYCVLRRCTAHDGIGENIYLALGVGLGAEDCYAYNGGKELATKGYAGAITNGESNFTMHGTTTNAWFRRCHSVDGYNGTSSFGVEQEGGVHSVGAVIDSCLIEQISATGHAADSQGNGVIWKNNVIYYAHGTGHGAEAMYIWNGADGEWFVNNTIRMTGDSKTFRVGTGCANIHYYNNLQIQDVNAGAVQAQVEGAASIVGWLADNQCYHGQEGYYWNAAYYTLANWKIQTSGDANCITDDPLVVNEDSDWHLQEGSPCRGAGKVGLAVVVSHDKDGNPRSSPPSMGAYE